MTSRRQFITLLGGAAAAWPVAAQAQQARPVVGFLGPTSLDVFGERIRGFQRGLREMDYTDGDNLTIAYRWAEGQFDRLPVLAGELVRRQVAVIAAGATAAAFAAKEATTTIPILFIIPEDPVGLGLVASLARPGGNVTGVNLLSGEVVAKRLELLRELVPAAARVAVLVDPGNAAVSQSTLRGVEAAARAMGLQTQVLTATSSREIDAAFGALVRERADALFVGPGGFFDVRRVQLATMAARHVVPMTSATREIAEVGGLMSYATNIADVWRQIGVYTGRILKGAKPADLPVVQAATLELVVNAQTARILGITVPPSLLAVADEVIE